MLILSALINSIVLNVLESCNEDELSTADILVISHLSEFKVLLFSLSYAYFNSKKVGLKSPLVIRYI